ncbi:MAG: hypothetical protein GY733_24590 [bacterium]|nr:hypothetical protein [bacterium]
MSVRAGGLRAAAGVSVLLGLCACVPMAGGWSVAALEAQHPSLMQQRGHRLGDTPPLFWPDADGAILFLCRFDPQSTIPVSLPVDATAPERAAIRLALQAWENAGLGIRFREADEVEAQIHVRFEPDPAAGQDPRRRIKGTGLTVSDCAVDRPSGEGAGPRQVLDAKLVRARVLLRRSNPDMVGREVAVSDDERVGAMLHEFGHALGFAGHVGTLDSVMASATDTVRRFGRRVRNGEPLRAPSLVALYAVPSGTIVGRARLSEQSRADFEAALRSVAGSDWLGPFARVGERSGQLHWRREGAIAGRLLVRDYVRALREGSELDFAPTLFARALRQAD